MIVKSFLRAHLVESVLLALCVALAVGFACALASLVSAYGATVRRDLGRPAWRQITVAPGGMGRIQGAAAVPATDRTVSPADFERLGIEEILTSCPSISHAWYEIPQVYVVAPGSTSEPGEPQPTPEKVPARTVSPGFFAAYGLGASEGDLFTEEDCRQGRQVAVLGWELARRFFPDGRAVGRSVLLGGSEYRIIGVLERDPLDEEPQGPNSLLYAPPKNTQITTGARGNVTVVKRIGTLELAVADPTRIDSAMRELTSFLDRVLGEGTYMTRSSRDVLIRERETATRLFGVVSLLAALALLVAAVNVLNMAMIRALRRARVVAICRAVGATIPRVFSSLCGELMAAALAGALAGAACAPPFAGVLGGVLLGGTRSIRTAPVALAGALVLSLVVTAAFGAVPLLSAAHRSPVDVLKTE